MKDFDKHFKNNLIAIAIYIPLSGMLMFIPALFIIPIHCLGCLLYAIKLYFFDHDKQLAATYLLITFLVALIAGGSCTGIAKFLIR